MKNGMNVSTDYIDNILNLKGAKKFAAVRKLLTKQAGTENISSNLSYAV